MLSIKFSTIFQGTPQNENENEKDQAPWKMREDLKNEQSRKGEHV
jgi:hypothetical protein